MAKIWRLNKVEDEPLPENKPTPAPAAAESYTIWRTKKVELPQPSAGSDKDACQAKAQSAQLKMPAAVNVDLRTEKKASIKAPLAEAKADAIDSVQFAKKIDPIADQRIANGDFSQVKAAPDFEKYSKAGASRENPAWNEAKGGGTLSIFGWSPFGKDVQNKVTFYLDNKKRGGEEAYEFLTDDEVGTYNYLLGKYGAEKSDEYLAGLAPELNARSTNALTQQAYDELGDNFWADAAASVGSILLSPGKALGEGYAVVSKLLGKEIDPNSKWFLPSHMSNAIRGAVAEDMSPVGSFLYDTGMSIGDFVLTTAMTGGFSAEGKAAEQAAKWGGLLVMGSGAASDAMLDAYDRNATEDEAFWVGQAAGVAEVLFEQFSLDQVIKMSSPTSMRKLVWNVFKQSGIEASEEMATETANIISDWIIMGDKSNWDTTVQRYVDGGMRLSEAQAHALWDSVKQIGLAGAGGALSGGAIGTVSTGVSASRAAGLGKAISGVGYTQPLIDSALQLSPDTDAYKTAAGLRAGSIDMTDQNVGYLFATYREAGGDTSFLKAMATPEEARGVESAIDAAGLGKETADGVKAAYARFAGRLQGNISPEGHTLFTSFQQTVLTIGRKAASVNAQLDAKLVQFRAKLSVSYQRVQALNAKLGAAAVSGDTAAYEAIKTECMAAISAYQNELDVANAQKRVEKAQTQERLSPLQEQLIAGAAELVEQAKAEAQYASAQQTAQMVSDEVEFGSDMNESFVEEDEGFEGTDEILDMSARKSAHGGTETVEDGTQTALNTDALESASNPSQESVAAQEANQASAVQELIDAILNPLTADGASDTIQAPDGVIEEVMNGGKQNERTQGRGNSLRDGEAFQSGRTGKESEEGSRSRRTQQSAAQTVRDAGQAGSGTRAAEGVVSRGIAAHDAKAAEHYDRAATAWTKLHPEYGITAEDFRPVTEPSEKTKEIFGYLRDSLGGNFFLYEKTRDGLPPAFTCGGRMYVRADEGSMMAFHAAHEWMHNDPVRMQLAMRVFDTLPASSLDRMIEQREADTGVTLPRAKAKEEICCDLFGAYVYATKNGAELYDVLGATQDEYAEFKRAFAATFTAEALEDAGLQDAIDRLSYYSGDADDVRFSTMRPENPNSGEEQHYDYSKSFAEQIDDWKAGKIPQNDTLVLGGTPRLYQQIGLSALPMTIDQTHVGYLMYGTDGKDSHIMPENVVKELPKLLSDPVAIIKSKTRTTDSVVVIVNKEISGRQVMAAIWITGKGLLNLEQKRGSISAWES